MKRLIFIIVTLIVLGCAGLAFPKGMGMDMGMGMSTGESSSWGAFNVTDNGGEVFRVTDGGGEDLNVRV